MGYIKLHKQNFFHNLEYFSKVCGDKEKISIALKDNAYSHGIEEISLMASEFGIKHVFVRTMDEADIAKKYGFETVLVLYDMPKQKDDTLIIGTNSLEDIQRVPNGSKIELKIDSGMNRNGIVFEDIEEALNIIQKKELIVHGAFTHFCCSEESNEIIFEQEQEFLRAIELLKKYIDYKFRIHCANSAGVFRIDMSKYDIARIGIGIYGYLDLEVHEKKLHPVLSLHAQKISTKTIKKGDHVGYGSDAFIASKKMTVSNYNIGYGDGLSRANSNKRRKIANGLDILGRISMDSFSVESSDEEVCVFDNAKHLASVHNTITYEVLTNLKANIKRIIV
jgi:alanine racemase